MLSSPDDGLAVAHLTDHFENPFQGDRLSSGPAPQSSLSSVSTGNRSTGSRQRLASARAHIANTKAADEQPQPCKRRNHAHVCRPCITSTRDPISARDGRDLVNPRST